MNKKKIFVIKLIVFSILTLRPILSREEGTEGRPPYYHRSFSVIQKTQESDLDFALRLHQEAERAESFEQKQAYLFQSYNVIQGGGRHGLRNAGNDSDFATSDEESRMIEVLKDVASALKYDSKDLFNKVVEYPFKGQHNLKSLSQAHKNHIAVCASLVQTFGKVERILRREKESVTVKNYESWFVDKFEVVLKKMPSEFAYPLKSIPSLKSYLQALKAPAIFLGKAYVFPYNKGCVVDYKKLTEWHQFGDCHTDEFYLFTKSFNKQSYDEGVEQEGYFEMLEKYYLLQGKVRSYEDNQNNIRVIGYLLATMPIAYAKLSKPQKLTVYRAAIQLGLLMHYGTQAYENLLFNPDYTIDITESELKNRFWLLALSFLGHFDATDNSGKLGKYFKDNPYIKSNYDYVSCNNPGNSSCVQMIGANLRKGSVPNTFSLKEKYERCWERYMDPNLYIEDKKTDINYLNFAKTIWDDPDFVPALVEVKKFMQIEDD